MEILNLKVMSKRMLIVNKQDYDKVGQLLNQMEIIWWNESGNFYFHFGTFMLTAALIGVISLVVFLLN